MFDDIIGLVQSLPIEWQHMLQGLYMIDKAPAEVLKVKEILDELSDEDRNSVLEQAIVPADVPADIDSVSVEVGTTDALPPEAQ